MVAKQRPSTVSAKQERGLRSKAAQTRLTERGVQRRAECAVRGASLVSASARLRILRRAPTLPGRHREDGTSRSSKTLDVRVCGVIQ